MRRDRKLALVAAGVLSSSARSPAGSRSRRARDDDKPLTGAALDKATAAALEHTGGGTVTETEVGDDGAAYGVEVRLDDGARSRSAWTRTSRVIGQEADDDGAADEDDGGGGDD